MLLLFLVCLSFDSLGKRRHGQQRAGGLQGRYHQCRPPHHDVPAARVRARQRHMGGGTRHEESIRRRRQVHQVGHRRQIPGPEGTGPE